MGFLRVRGAKIKAIARVAVFAMLCVGLVSCAMKGDDAIEKQCITEPDQASLYFGHWLVRPIPLAVQAGEFSAGELNAIVASINTWNDFFSSSKGFKLYLNNGATL